MFPELFSVYDVETFGKDRIFTESFSFSLHSDRSDCMIVTAYSRFEGDAAPTVEFCLTDGKFEKPVYASHAYSMGKKGHWTRQQWRVPPMFHPSLHAEITVTIPKGTKLELADFHNSYSDAAKPWLQSGPRHNAHLGFWGLAPGNTRRSIELAAQCGFSSCIVNVKETRDGYLICHHDPTINRYATNDKGIRLKDNPDYPPLEVSEMTLAELQTWDLSGYRHPLYAESGVLLLEDAFRIMAKTGLQPMFSTHPAPSVEAWYKVKDMLLRYGLTKRFHVKSFQLEILETAFSVFGDSIDGYTWDKGNVDDLKKSKLYGANCRLGIELTKKAMTRELARSIIDAGFFAAVFALNERVPYSELEEMMDWGITEFTEDHHCSMGLNW